MNKQHWEHEGHLYSEKTGYETPLRKDYSKHFRKIETGQQVRSCLRAGEYAWPGGYQLAFYTADGALLCYGCVKDSLELVTWSIRNDVNDGWRVVGTGIMHDHESESGEHCDHCNKQLAEPIEEE